MALYILTLPPEKKVVESLMDYFWKHLYSGVIIQAGFTSVMYLIRTGKCYKKWNSQIPNSVCDAQTRPVC